MTKLTASFLALACLATAGCATNRYPMALTWSPASGENLTCTQLSDAAEDGHRLQAQIEGIASGDAKGRAERPRLYSTEKSDADRAVQARLAAIQAQRQTQGCV
ncbi:hypothetical protein [Brevundimonas nasdae]|uniref:hypothetical protein n=1 Tax=Brevundimonas nasdae TaxID=172043 RepID=UPI0028A1E4BF|nr:hypothetical protein [Brevundimonas nasdae]